MVAANNSSSYGTYSGNFFKDFHGLQQLSDQHVQTVTVAECNFCNLEDVFKNSEIPDAFRCLLYLNYLKEIIKGQILAKVKDDIPIEEMVFTSVLKVLSFFNENNKLPQEIFSKMSASALDKINKVLDFLNDKIPPNFFKKKSKSMPKSNNNINILKPNLNPLFFIPLKETFPELDKIFQKDQDKNISLCYNQPQATTSKVNNAFCLEELFECYKTLIPGYNYNEFGPIIYNELSSSKSNDDVMEYFLETFGLKAFDFLNEIINNRGKKINYGPNLVVKAPMRNANLGSQPNATLAGQVTVQSKEESILSKKLRKLEKKDRSKYCASEIQETEAEYEVARATPLFKKSAPQKLDRDEYPHVHDQLRNHMITTKFEGQTISQPENAIKKVTIEYAEFTIPGGKKGDVKDMELVKVDTLDTVGKLVFKDIEKFNRIQSEVFPVAYHSNENILVCAPTGAGKTNIALLTIVHQVRSHMDGSLIKKNDFKIVYVCPMKALATEMVSNFSKKLGPIGISVKECTGDMQLTKKEISETQMLVTTPEKWDVITRKGAVDTEVVGLVKLLIIDEVHLLNGSRGPVIETLVARTLRQVVSSQSMIRIVALSATLPGYLDVANFLKVNTRSGLFFFDNRYRSVPLTTTFVGVKKKNENEAMVFVTSRNATASVAKKLIETAQVKGTLQLFEPEKSVQTMKSGYKSGDLSFLIPHGYGIHHAGMVRSDRLEVERLFRIGQLKVIVCTTTLAWGVNLPAHAVIIRGTQHYDATKSTFVDMDMLDVQQIFGRAGRPQFDTSGHGIIITSMANMSNYMGLMTSQVPIESQFLNCVPDNLNAEYLIVWAKIVLGTVSNLREAMEWLSNTFLYCRIKKNPLVYGLTYNEIWDSHQFNLFLQSQLDSAAKTLEKSQMIRFDNSLGEFRPTNFGRIASFYYISYKTMELIYDKFHSHISEAELLHLISEASEFAQIQVRMDEIQELDRLRECNLYELNLDFTSVVAKTVTRLARALFEIAKDKDYALQVSRTLKLAQMLEQQLWDHHHPLMQFKELIPHLASHRAMDILNIPIHELREMSERELEGLFRSKHVGNRVRHCCQIFPQVLVDVTVKPITDGVIRVRLLITPKFKWDHAHHGTVQHYYAWVEDPTHDSIYHFESFIITKKLCVSEDPIELVFTVPLTKPLSLEYFVRVSNSQFMYSETIEVINLEEMKIFSSKSYQTKILDVQPLSKNLLRDKSYESLYSFTHFNAVQSQVFHSCYHTDTPVILGAPTGSGKTIVAELCMLRLFKNQPQLKVVYIAPMKALVRERVLDWSAKFAKISKTVVEVTGDITPRSDLIRSANVIITTPEKWDAMSRNWMEKNFVKEVGLMVIDEIHLLGEDRGPVLEVIVSRMNCINSKSNKQIRIVGLSTAMANPGDLAYWLNADKRGLFNFSSAVRPVPLEIHLQGFQVKHYCPRMAAMNKSVYQAICQYAENSSALIFVSSRKQTRITGYELMKFLLSDANPQKWVHCDQTELDSVKDRLIDQDLCQLLTFGIGMHHAGLTESDRQIVEHLLQLAVALCPVYCGWIVVDILFDTHHHTVSNLAWTFISKQCCNESLIEKKGTEYFDGATKRYVDMPVTDVIQMVGRAGRPQFDNTGVACVMVQENKKAFYRKFLFEPFPVESNLLEVLPDHVNAEVANGNITSKGQLLEFIQSTFFYRRLLANPSYYQMDASADPEEFVSDLADSVIQLLQHNECVATQDCVSIT
ncbi:unnamed protein product [Brassicogethes aeneus]|uniref:Activating signal cointegrator 1 complex subunit 3 n=1 Tax=Brassicogethes aeneus TaxID=1431903 RepID=A0A9P0B4F8_BRAAE|nr:unnamed protein product [Brassicogethes aeneus]